MLTMGGVSRAVFFLTIVSFGLARSSIGKWESCGGRLERALDTIHRESSRRNRLDEEDVGMRYQQRLHSAPIEMSVSRIIVKIPQAARDTVNQWARVDKCVYDSSNNSLQTRVMISDLSVSGIVSLTPQIHQPSVSAESCRMTLRLRRAGVDFLTNPIARGRGQMRIRTESSFLEPRFASIYAYGCHPTRLDKQIKRQDKWPPFYPPRDEYTALPAIEDEYEAAEPRQLVGVSKEDDVVIPNEARQSDFVSPPIARLGIWRKNVWQTKSSTRRKRTTEQSNAVGTFPDTSIHSDSYETTQDTNDSSVTISRSSTMMTASQDFANVLSDKWSKTNGTGNCTQQHEQDKLCNMTNDLSKSTNDSDMKLNFKRDNSYHVLFNDDEKETRHLYIDDTLDNVFPIDLGDDSRDWQSKEHVAREMEDVFLRGASQALTRYIEKQLHPAIKETLMISMGYTISYG